MQNKEVEEFQNKKAQFCLFEGKKKDGELVYEKLTHQTVVETGQYAILWYDAKMQNYLNLLKYLNKRKIVQAKVKAYLVVDKEEYAENVDKIREQAKEDALKTQVRVLLKRELTDEESLLLAFGEDGAEAQGEADEAIDLELKKNFFYVINPQGRIIDLAKIYSFMHEDNIYQRIVAKTLKDADDLRLQ